MEVATVPVSDASNAADKTKRDTRTALTIEFGVLQKNKKKWLRKTRICGYNLRGACRFGSQCTFAHSAAQVQATPNLSKTQLCQLYAAGNCFKDNCSFAHGLEELRPSPHSNSKICKWFAEGTCRNGSKCTFAHGTEAILGETSTDAEGQARAISPPPELLVEGQACAISPPPGLGLAASEVKVPIVLELANDLSEVKVPADMPMFIDLQSSILDEKVPGPPSSLELQLEDMTAQISVFQKQIDDIALHTEVSSMKRVLEELTVQCAAVQQSLEQTSPIDTIGVSTCTEMTPLKTSLSSKAAPFQPSMPWTSSPQATPWLLADSETQWQSDDSTSIGSGSLFSD